MRPFILSTLALTFLVATSCAKGKREMPEKRVDLSGKKVLMVIAHQDFRDEEYQKPRKIFEDFGAQVVVASSALGLATGMLGLTVAPDTLLQEVKAADFDAVVFVGGRGATEYWENANAHRLIKDAVDQGKVLGAICLAPVTLANAGVLEDKKATVFHTASGELKAKGAIYTGASVQVTGNIVTADGPQAAEQFGKTVANLLAGK